MQVYLYSLLSLIVAGEAENTQKNCRDTYYVEGQQFFKGSLSYLYVRDGQFLGVFVLGKSFLLLSGGS